MINKRTLKAFTMIELVFVIIVMGIIGKFGVEFLFQAYNGFINTKINSTLQSNSTSAVEFVANRLQHRIKASVIARESNNTYFGLSGYTNPAGTAPILEWVSGDVDGFRGTTLPYWSGIIDLDPSESNITRLTSPGTDINATDNLIKILSDNNSTINDAALYFIGSDSDIVSGYGWDGTANDQTKTMHPIQSNGNPGEFAPLAGTGDFTNVSVSEYYKLAWTAYAVGIDVGDYDTTEKTGTLSLWYDYQPWNGQNYKTHGKQVTIMENVSTFQFTAVGNLVKIQVCSNSDLLKDEGKEYSVCKEKTIY